MRILGLLFLLLWPLSSWGGSLALVPEEIGTGEVTLLRWQGEQPSMALARFNDRVIDLTLHPSGASTLLGADIALEPGEYPVLVAVVDRQGQTVFAELTLRVRPVSRKVERLSLPKAMVTPQKPSILRRIARERKLLRELFGRVEQPLRLRPFSLPVPSVMGSPFGLQRILNGIPKSPHGGIDFRSPRGTPVESSGEGRVVFAGDLYYTGGTVIVDHGGGLFTLYAHLDKILVPERGHEVRRGDIIGTVGSTGRSTGPHLHWGIKLRGDRVDPLSVMRALSRETP